MAALQDWQALLPAAYVKFALLAEQAEDVDFRYGLLSSAVLWPIRQAAQDGDEETIATLKHILNQQAEPVTVAVQKMSVDPLQTARSLQVKAQQDDALKAGLDMLISTFDAQESFILTLAKTLTHQPEDKSRLFAIAGQIQAQLVDIGGTVNIRNLIFNLNLGARPALSKAEARERQNQVALLEKVKRFWIEGVLERTLYHTVLLELGKTPQPDAVSPDYPWIVKLGVNGEASSTELAKGQSIYEIFIGSNRSLLILGEPGSGKSTTLLEMCRDAITQAERNPGEPMPVVFNLSSWAAQQWPLEKWLIEELSNKYQVPRKICGPWVVEDRLLLLLDGLDEVRADSRLACVKAINDYRQAHSLIGVAICSRTGEYRELKEKLRLGSAIQLEQLRYDQVETYLRAGGQRLAALRQTIHTDAGLREMARSPLMLNIMALAYQDAPQESIRLSNIRDRLERRKQLFENYVARMFQRAVRTKAQSYTPEETITSLHWLAQRLRANNITLFLVEQIQPDWLPNAVGTERRVIKGLWVLLGLVIAIWFWICYKIFANEAMDLISYIFIGLIVFLGVAVAGLILVIMPLLGLYYWLFRRRIVIAETITWSVARFQEWWETDRKKWFSISEDVSCWQVIVLIGCLIFAVGYMCYFFSTQPGSVGMCFSVVLPFVVIILWLGGLRLGELTIKETTTQGIWRSGRNALLVGLPIFLIVLVGASIGWYYAFNPSRGLKAETVIDKMIYFFPLALGIIAGVVAGLISGGDTFVRHFILRFLLYRKHCIPWNITRFLDYAAERILLQKVGGGYIFIHRYLLEYFAGLDLTKK